MRNTLICWLLASFVIFSAGCAGGGEGAQGGATGKGQAVAAEKTGGEQAVAESAAEQKARKPEKGYYHLSPEKVDEFVSKGAIVLDVRNPSELRGPLGAIDGAINIPLNQLSSRTNELDKNTGYIVNCVSGNRSCTGCEILVSHGFEYVYNLEGGIKAYRRYQARQNEN